jgi:hypothetical protein
MLYNNSDNMINDCTQRVTKIVSMFKLFAKTALVISLNCAYFKCWIKYAYSLSRSTASQIKVVFEISLSLNECAVLYAKQSVNTLVDKQKQLNNTKTVVKQTLQTVKE